MIWLAVSVVVVLLVFSTGFRKVAAVVAVICGVGIGIILLVNTPSRSTARSLIPASDVELRDLRLGGSYSHSLSGRGKNNSASHTLTDLKVLVVMRDCTDEAHTQCETIGEEPVSLWFDNIPPGQVRDIRGGILLHTPAKPKGKFAWSYSIVETEGK
jgi:hypothetical protein